MATPASPWHDDLPVLYGQRYEPMVRVAYLLTGHRDVAEELVQDAFVSLWRNWDHVTVPAGYLRAAVVNNARSWLRRRSLEERRAERPAIDAAQRVDEMWDVLQSLSERQRAAIVLRYYEDLPDADIARILGCRVPTVRTTIHRGLAALRKEVER